MDLMTSISRSSYVHPPELVFSNSGQVAGYNKVKLNPTKMMLVGKTECLAATDLPVLNGKICKSFGEFI